MHWVHIIKAPTAKHRAEDLWDVSLLVRIMSDLSDRELNEPVTVYALLDSPNTQLRHQIWQQCDWKPRYWLEPLSESSRNAQALLLHDG